MERRKIGRWVGMAVVALFLLVALGNPEKVMEGAGRGLVLWYGKVLPVQFPFIVGARLLLQLRKESASPHLMVWSGGWLAGFPSGSFFAADQYRSGRLKEQEVLPMVLLSNTSGPLFVVGTVGVAMWGSRELGVLLLGIHYAAAVLTAAVFYPWGIERKKVIRGSTARTTDIGKLLGEVAGEAASIMVKVGEFIVLFSVVTALLPLTEETSWWGLGIGLLEITGGLACLSGGGGVMTPALLAMVSFLLGFSGLSILFQTMTMLRETPCSMGKLLPAFLCRGAIAAGLGWLAGMVVLVD